MLPLPPSHSYLFIAELLFQAEIMLLAWGVEGGAEKLITLGYCMHKIQLSSVSCIAEYVSWAERLTGWEACAEFLWLQSLASLTGGILTKLSGCCGLATDFTLLLNFTALQVISSSVTSWQLWALLGRRRVTVKMNSLLAWCIRSVGFSPLYN